MTTALRDSAWKGSAVTDPGGQDPHSAAREPRTGRGHDDSVTASVGEMW